VNDLEKRMIDRFRRLRDFDAMHEALFPPGTLGRDLFNIIGGVVNDLEGYAATESGGRGAARQFTVTKASARAAIFEDLGILRRTARTMHSVQAGIEEKFRVPYGHDDEELLSHARAALAAAEPLKADFLRREVQARVFQDLAANIESFSAALIDRNTAKDEALTAAAAIDAAINRGMDALRQLDAIVRNKLHNDTATLAAWLSARRIERAARRNNNDSTPTAPQTPDK
jgi:hypothetical protein